MTKRVGEQNFVTGLDLAIRLMKEGEHSIVRMTARHGYGTEGSSIFQIPPNSRLEYDVEFVRLGSKRRAVEEMSQAERLEDCRDFQDKAKIHFLKGHFEEAEKLYTRALIFGNDAGVSESHKYEKIRCLNNVAVVEYKLRKFKESKVACDQVLSLDPENTKAIYRLALLHENESEYKEAVSLFERVLKLQRAETVKEATTEEDNDNEVSIRHRNAIRRTEKSIRRVKRVWTEYRESQRKFSKAMLRRRKNNEEAHAEVCTETRNPIEEGEQSKQSRRPNLLLFLAFGFTLAAFGFWVVVALRQNESVWTK